MNPCGRSQNCNDFSFCAKTRTMQRNDNTLCIHVQILRQNKLLFHGPLDLLRNRKQVKEYQLSEQKYSLGTLLDLQVAVGQTFLKERTRAGNVCETQVFDDSKVPETCQRSHRFEWNLASELVATQS